MSSEIPDVESQPDASAEAGNPPSEELEVDDMANTTEMRLDEEASTNEADVAEAENEDGAEADSEADEADEADEDAPLPGEDDSEGPGLERSVELRGAKLKSVLESLIFVADRPVPIRNLARAAKSKIADIRPVLDELIAEYAERGLNLIEVGGGLQFRSSVDNAPFVRDFVARKPVRLSRAQLETLSIVAYRQPVTRPEIDDIRGVDSGSALKVLSDRSLLKVLGRKDEPGRPLLYGTSPHFLEFFGLKSLKELPTLQEFTELSDESRGIFEQKLGEPLDLGAVEKAAQAAEAKAQDEMFDHNEQEADSDEDGEEGAEPITAVGEKAARADEDAEDDEDADGDEESDSGERELSEERDDSDDDDSDDDDSDDDDADDDDADDDDADDDDSDDDDSDDDDD